VAPDRERLARLLGGAQLDRLRARLRSRYERGRDKGAVTLARLDDAERAAMCGLLGRRPAPGASLRFDIGELDGVLRRAGLADSLRHALEILDGPLADRAAERERAQQGWLRLLNGRGEARLAGLLREPRGGGLLKRLANGDVETAERLCRQAEQVLERLPATAVGRSQLAAQLLGDAHALDAGRPVSTLVLAALRRDRNDDETQSEADESDRAVWASIGVLVNELARPALALNLRALGAVIEPGEPYYLSLRALVRRAVTWDVNGAGVFVCENPNIVAHAADVLGEHCAALVCTDGMPSAAQRTLLTQLLQAGARLHYHGDFDWPGIGIANVLIDRFGAVPWRLGTADYVAAVEAARGERVLGDAVREPSWDPELGRVMRMYDRGVDEEAVAHILLDDLDTRRYR
jgi:uncharacterized protein (TIGR02679 family)